LRKRAPPSRLGANGLYQAYCLGANGLYQAYCLGANGLYQAHCRGTDGSTKVYCWTAGPWQGATRIERQRSAAMAQSTILAAASTAATSSNIEVTAGNVVTVGLFSPGPDGIPSRASAAVYQDSPGRDVLVTTLEPYHAVTQLFGPGTFRVVRPKQANGDVGVFLED
jgi:hypothetical protein